MIFFPTVSWILRKTTQEGVSKGGLGLGQKRYLQVLEQIFKRVSLDFFDHSLNHLLSDEFLLGVLGVASGLNLSLNAAGEGDAEETHEVTVLGLGLSERLNKGMPLLDEGAKLITGDVESVVVGKALESLDLLAADLDLSEGLVGGVTVQVSEVDLEDASLERVGGVLLTSTLVAGCDGGCRNIKGGGYVHIVPLFADERMGELFFHALLLEVLRVLASSHDVWWCSSFVQILTEYK